jgi:hypothetical protein
MVDLPAHDKRSGSMGEWGIIEVWRSDVMETGLSISDYHVGLSSIFIGCIVQDEIYFKLPNPKILATSRVNTVILEKQNRSCRLGQLLI